MRVDDLDYDLPDELIAQEPLPDRDAARLLVFERGSAAFAHRTVRDLPGLLPPSLVVVNDTRVLPARVFGHKPSGGRVELLFVEPLPGDVAQERWVALGRASKGLDAGARVVLPDGSDVEILGRREGGEIEVRVQAEGGVRAMLERIGAMPLPPYIRRAAGSEDRSRYQTVFAARPGAVAAPTAGLHLDEALMDAMRAAGHRFATVTLHVGPGTFRPVKVDDLDEHPMHEEAYDVPNATALAIAEAKAEGRPVLAIGTTVVRTLESAADPGGAVRSGEGRTRLLIQPPYAFRVVDALLTNFHLPRSTLLALVMAFGGIDTVRGAYAEAVRTRYRFFSYGDAMLIRPRNPS